MPLDQRLLMVLLTSLFSFGCTHLFYQPSQEMYFEPKQAKIEYQEIKFQSEDGTQLSGWYFPALKDSKKRNTTIVQFHGNAENLSSHFASLIWVISHGFNLFVFDYRGYGKSDGKPNQEGVQKDALSAINWAMNNPADQKPDHIILYGQSLGGAVVLGAFDSIPDKGKIELLVIEGSFASYKSVARKKLSQSWITWIFQPLAYLLVSDSTSGKDRLSKLAPTPLLVIHGEDDRIVPFDQGKKIFEEASEPKTFWIIPKGRHLDTYFRERGKYRKQFVDFVEDIEKGHKDEKAK